MDNKRQSSPEDEVFGNAALVAHIARFNKEVEAVTWFALVCKTWAAVVRCTAPRFGVELDTQASAEGAAAALNRAYAARPYGDGRTAPVTVEMQSGSSSVFAAHFFQALSERARAAVVGLTCVYMCGLSPVDPPLPHQLLPSLQSLAYESCYLPSLHIADLPHLTSIKLYECALGTLTLGANLTRLEKLHCVRTQIPHLDLSSVPQLSHLVVCSTGLTALNLSSVLQLTSLDVSGNQLSELNVEGLQFLEHFTCVDNRKLTSLTLASPRLRHVFCSGCPLTQLTIRDASGLQRVQYTLQEGGVLSLPTPAPVGLKQEQVPLPADRQ